MIVIADTSPLNYLIRIGHIDLLPQLYDQIVIPPSVLAELRRPGAPKTVRDWIEQPAAWLDIQAPLQTPDIALLQARLGPGEQEAILLAQEVKADEIIIDELRGRREAARRQIRVTGTIGVLQAAAKLGLLDLRSALERLRGTNFRIEKAFLDRLIRGEEV
jgi:predicted nucleic acid-binding protein